MRGGKQKNKWLSVVIAGVQDAIERRVGGGHPIIAAKCLADTLNQSRDRDFADVEMRRT